ncbi:MAG TPA: hypothetical protein PKM25_05720, partial [Candidatus Ozemobacteraceae bacterium]|nr:hypothetical protein [Candidatus Ozemobacteraceae bacterium]
MRCDEPGGRFRPGRGVQGVRGPWLDSTQPVQLPESDEPVHLVCFDASERETILRHMTVRGRKELPGSPSPVFQGTIDDREVTLLRLPFGDNPALLRQVVQEHIAAVHPRYIVALGSCMAFAEDLEPGDVLVTRQAICGSERIEIPPIPQIEALWRAVPHQMNVREGTTLTVRRFVGSQADRERLRAEHPDADMLEMEDFHLAGLFKAAGIGFISLRAVTDRGDFGDHLDNLGLAIDRTLLLARRLLRQLSMERRLSFLSNPPTLEIPYRILLRTPGREMTLPAAVRTARKAVRGFALGRILSDDTRLEIVILPEGPLSAWSAVPGGRAAVVETAGWVFLHAAEDRFAKLILRPDALDDPPGTALAAVVRHAAVIDVAAQGPDAPEGRMPAPRGVHVQGLNSISAEPEEGLLAATTLEECLANGFPVVDSADATIWIYRTANADATSYFEPPYELPMRFPGPPTPGTALIATGLGPAIDPEAAGGEAADVLML